ncbi:MAG: kelch repeat-containing protein [Paracoccaceae bacterium]
MSFRAIPVIAALVAVLAGPAAAQWTPAAPLPDLRTEVSVTGDGQRLFLAGGYGVSGDQLAAPRAVYAYDPGADAWERLTDLPQGLNHTALVHLDGALFVIGGQVETSSDPVATVWIYDIAGDRWREGPPLAHPRGAHAATLHAGRIHVIGGVGPNGNIAAHEIYDPASNQWTAAADMPTPRDHHAVVSVGDRIVVLAGRDQQTTRMQVNEIYDPATDRWQAGADLPTGRSGVAGVALDGYVYLIGGEGFNPATTFAEVERYDPVADTWQTMPPLGIARHGLGAAVIDGRIHVVSGGPEAGFTFGNAQEVLVP